MRRFCVAQWKRRSAAAVLLAAGTLAGGAMARAQAGPPAKTVQLPPSLENQTLQGVKYNNKYELYGGFAFSHFNSGPSLVQGTNLGGFDAQATRWLSPRLGATANVRGYYGTQGVPPNMYGIRGPMVYEHMFLGGITARGPRNEHAAINLHALVGGSYGVFSSGLHDQNGNPVPPPVLGLFNNGFSLATALGGSLDLNRSPRLALRLSPDYILTRFGGVNQNEFGISVGLLFRFNHVEKPKLPHF